MTGATVVRGVDVLFVLGAGTNNAARNVTGRAVTASPFEDAGDVAAGAILQGMGAIEGEAGLEVVKIEFAAGGKCASRHQQEQR